MTEIALPGCHTTPLGSYLSSLGLLRAVTRLLDPQTTGRWDRGNFILGSRFSGIDELSCELLAHFEPEAIVSPWLEGAGFVAKSANKSAAATIQRVRDSSDPRLGPLRTAVSAADRVVALGLERGWGGTGKALWDKDRKPELLALCRNEFPDDALVWTDAVAALGQDEKPAYSRLLGTSGNFGRQDLSDTYISQALRVFEDARSRSWLRAVLSGDENVAYLRETVGQFDPGRAGGVQSSTWEGADTEGFVNPWSFLLTIEGTLLFTSAIVRRYGAEYSRASLPFQTKGSKAGLDSAAPDEVVLGELWTPEWAVPATTTEVAHLLAEGRADWQGRAARSGLDVARAIASLGVDRGLTAFGRHVFVNRRGQNPLAVPAGRMKVGRRAGVDLLAALDAWLDQLSRATVPSTVAARVRSLEQAVFTHARDGTASALIAVIAALGRCHYAVACSGAARAAVPPLVLASGKEMLETLAPAIQDDPELRVALVLASARDEQWPTPPSPTLHGLRGFLSPVTGSSPADRKPRWSQSHSFAAPMAGLVAALSEAARRRGFPGAVSEEVQDLQPAVRGVRIPHQRGLLLGTGDVQRFVTGAIDDERTAELLHGLLTVDWRGTADRTLPSHRSQSDPTVEMLLPFCHAGPLDLPHEEGGSFPILLRPGSSWPALLAGERVTDVLTDAARRLRVAGVQRVICPRESPRRGRRLAAALLLRVSDKSRLAALRHIAVLSETTRATDPEEITA